MCVWRVWTERNTEPHTVLCEKIEPLFFLDYSANMYSRKMLSEFWSSSRWTDRQKATPKSPSRISTGGLKKQGVQFFAGNCREVSFCKISSFWATLRT